MRTDGFISGYLERTMNGRDFAAEAIVSEDDCQSDQRCHLSAAACGRLHGDSRLKCSSLQRSERVAVMFSDLPEQYWPKSLVTTPSGVQGLFSGASRMLQSANSPSSAAFLTIPTFSGWSDRVGGCRVLLRFQIVI